MLALLLAFKTLESWRDTEREVSTPTSKMTPCTLYTTSYSGVHSALYSLCISINRPNYKIGNVRFSHLQQVSGSRSLNTKKKGDRSKCPRQCGSIRQRTWEIRHFLLTIFRQNQYDSTQYDALSWQWFAMSYKPTSISGPPSPTSLSTGPLPALGSTLLVLQQLVVVLLHQQLR